MIAAADLYDSPELMEFNAGLEIPFSDDALVPGADPYIAQLVAEHEAEMNAHRGWNDARMSRPSLRRPSLRLELAMV